MKRRAASRGSIGRENILPQKKEEGRAAPKASIRKEGVKR